jgi:hypothetical protein
MHACDKADNRSKSAQRYDAMTALCRADPAFVSINLVWRLHPGAMQSRQLTTCLRYSCSGDCGSALNRFSRFSAPERRLIDCSRSFLSHLGFRPWPIYPYPGLERRFSVRPWRGGTTCVAGTLAAPECVCPKGSDGGPDTNEAAGSRRMKLFFKIALFVYRNSRLVCPADPALLRHGKWDRHGAGMLA